MDALLFAMSVIDRVEYDSQLTYFYDDAKDNGTILLDWEVYVVVYETFVSTFL